MSHIDILQIEPQPPLVTSALPFWKVQISGRQISAKAFPFYARDRIIGLDAAGELPDWRQTTRRVSVRRAGEYALWLPLLASEGADQTTLAEPLVFHGTQYTAAIDKAIKQMRESGFVLPDHSRNGGWYTMTAAELRETLTGRHAHDAAQLQQAAILQRMRTAINDLQDFDICEPPDAFNETRIALTDGTDAIWRHSRVRGRVAVRFVANPAFPLWLHSPAFDAVFSLESFG